MMRGTRRSLEAVPWRAVAVLMLLSCKPWAPAIAQAAAAAAPADEWNFTVLLNDQSIGNHRFRVGGPPTARTVTSEASFDVKLLGLSVYRYRHQAEEQWRGDCLAVLEATTEDGGDRSTVRATAAPGGLSVEVAGAAQVVPGCVMGFAYWNPAMRQQSRLLNAQTGRMEDVRIREAGEGTIDANGRTLPARRWRIEGPAQPITLWYGNDGRWLGLDAEVRGGRQLRYRLR
jgi:hypothetical protein